MGCVEGRGRPGVVMLLLVLVVALTAATSDGVDGYGGTAEDCVVYQLQEEETSLVSFFEEGEIVLGVHTEHSSEFTLAGLQLQLNTEHDSLTASFAVDESTVYCNNRTHDSTDVYYQEFKTWWQHVHVSMKNNKLLVGDSSVCREGINGSNPNLTVQSNTGQALIVFNCQPGCPTMDDASVTSLDQLPYERQIHVKNTSSDAEATLRLLLHSCDSSGQTKNLNRDPCDDQRQEDIKLKASDLNGDWNRLLLRNTNISMHNTTENITVVTVGEMIDIFTTTSKYSILKVVNSTNMLWAVDCDPRVQVKVFSQTGPDSTTVSITTQAQVTNNLIDDGTVADNEAVCMGSKGYWKCTAVLFILICLIFVSFICGIFICKHLKKRKKALGDSEGHVLVDKSEHSHTSQSLLHQPSHASRRSSVPPVSNSNSVQNSHSVITTPSLSTDEDNLLHRKFPPPPSSLPPLPIENQDSMPAIPLVCLESTMQEHTDNMDDDDEYDYDYMDINMLKQQLDKDKEDEERKKQMGEEETKMEVERNMNMKIDKADLSCNNSTNSLYEPFSLLEAGGTVNHIEEHKTLDNGQDEKNQNITAVERNMNTKIDEVDSSRYNSMNSLYEPFSILEAEGIENHIKEHKTLENGHDERNQNMITAEKDADRKII